MNIIVLYFLVVNLVSGILFACDKRRARKGFWRVPEWVLHLCELMGGVFSVMVLMYVIRHKNRKASYFLLTYLILLAWLAFAVYLLFSQSR